MNKQELISMYERISNFSENVNTKKVIANLQQLDKPQAGHAEKAPCYLRNVIARLRELPLHDREVWLKAIMDEFEEDFSHSIWREGYEQGKFEASMIPCDESQKPVVPQSVSDWIELCKKSTRSLQGAIHYAKGTDVERWLIPSDNQETFARAWLDGYEVEKEKRYLVKIKGVNEECEFLVFGELSNTWKLRSLGAFGELRKHHTRKELEEAGFGWVFSCEGVEIEEVTE